MDRYKRNIKQIEDAENIKKEYIKRVFNDDNILIKDMTTGQYEQMLIFIDKEMAKKQCNHEEILIKNDDYFESVMGYNYLPLNLTIELSKYGYIRFIVDGDKNCLDHGDKYKIKYCPLCGYEFKEESNG